MSDKERDYAEVIQSQGAEFLGIQLGPQGALVLFSDPTSWTTLAVYELEFSPLAVSQRLQKSRQAFALVSHVSKITLLKMPSERWRGTRTAISGSGRNFNASLPAMQQ